MISEKDDNIVIDIDNNSLLDILEPDNEEILKLKSLEDKEDEFSLHYGMFEQTIAYYYNEENGTITDKEVIKVLKDIRSNLGKKMNYFKHPLAESLIENTVEIGNEEAITVHEFNLVIDYMVKSIDNRSWMADRQAYLKWVCYYLDIATVEDNARYVKRVERLAKKHDMPPEMVDSLLEKNPNFKKGKASDSLYLNSEFLAMNEDEKFDYLAKNATNEFNLFMAYLFELEKRGDIELAKKLAKRVSKKFGDIFTLHMKVGAFFMHIDPTISKGYYNRALASLENVKVISDDMKLEIAESIKDDIRLCDKHLN
ncbi:MAG: hypothetical protein K8R13_04655 [Methanococcoides sp.]|nr:hypothetical protein [Methanococcoides sp.]